VSDPEFLLKNSALEQLRLRVDDSEDEKAVLAALEDMAGYLTNHRTAPTRPEPLFDLFRGVPRTADVIWIESVKGLAAARDRIDALAAERPGAYFVFSCADHSYLAIVDTTVRNKKSDVA
jgi:hypothetical protein